MWINANWKKILIWDINLKVVFQNLKYKPEILLSKPVLIEHLSNNQKIRLKKYIILFEIQPFRLVYSSSVGGDIDYYDYTNCYNFINNIIRVCSKYNINIVIKRKRAIGKIIDQKYSNYINNLLKNNSNIFLIHNEYLIDDLINNSLLSISMPYTSAAYLSKFLNKPSIFYDSSGKLEKEDNLSKDIICINDIQKLEMYINSIVR